MKLQHPPLVQWLALSLVFGFVMLFLYQVDIVAYRYKAVQPFHADLGSLRPAGEITADFLLEQPVHVAATDLPRRDLKLPFCVAILMANYMNRRNLGEFSVSLSVGPRQFTRILQARNIRDNEKAFVCFSGITLAELMGQPARLTIKGIDGRPGRSVTAWLEPTADVTARATLDGQPTDRQLVFSTHVRVDAFQYKMDAYVLLVLTVLLTAALVLTLHRYGSGAADAPH